mgnify:FL=1
MIKPELIQAISDKTRMPKNKIEAVIDSFTEIIEEEVGKGQKVKISGFGSFYSSVRVARSGINPNTKEKIQIGDMRLPRFKPGTKFKKAVQNQK